MLNDQRGGFDLNPAPCFPPKLRLTTLLAVQYHQRMFNPLLKFTAPLVLLLGLLFLSGIVSAATSLSGPSADACCTAAEEQQRPTTEDDCADHSCSCHCCNVSILTSHALQVTIPQESLAPQWSLRAALSADYVHAIDYPPEAT